MRHVVPALRFLLVPAALGFGLGMGCGDDTTDSGGMDGGSSGTDAGMTLDTGVVGIPDLGIDQSLEDIYDCQNQGFDTCDGIACTVNAAYELLIVACDSPLAPDFCGAVESCFRTYTSCIVSACPAGTPAAQADEDSLNACVDNYNACVQAAMGG